MISPQLADLMNAAASGIPLTFDGADWAALLASLPESGLSQQDITDITVFQRYRYVGFSVDYSARVSTPAVVLPPPPPVIPQPEPGTSPKDLAFIKAFKMLAGAGGFGSDNAQKYLLGYPKFPPGLARECLPIRARLAQYFVDAGFNEPYTVNVAELIDDDCQFYSKAA